jgi:hypothetical protein
MPGHVDIYSTHIIILIILIIIIIKHTIIGLLFYLVYAFPCLFLLDLLMLVCAFPSVSTKSINSSLNISSGLDLSLALAME